MLNILPKYLILLLLLLLKKKNKIKINFINKKGFKAQKTLPFLCPFTQNEKTRFNIRFFPGT